MQNLGEPVIMPTPSASSGPLVRSDWSSTLDGEESGAVTIIHAAIDVGGEGSGFAPSTITLNNVTMWCGKVWGDAQATAMQALGLAFEGPAIDQEKQNEGGNTGIMVVIAIFTTCAVLVVVVLAVLTCIYRRHSSRQVPQGKDGSVSPCREPSVSRSDQLWWCKHTSPSSTPTTFNNPLGETPNNRAGGATCQSRDPNTSVETETTASNDGKEWLKSASAATLMPRDTKTNSLFDGSASEGSFRAITSDCGMASKAHSFRPAVSHTSDGAGVRGLAASCAADTSRSKQPTGAYRLSELVLGSLGLAPSSPTVSGSVASSHLSGPRNASAVRGEVALAIQQLQESLRSDLHEEQLEVYRIIGRGGFGTVYYGRNNKHYSTTQLPKMMIFQSDESDLQSSRVTSEVAIASNLVHPNIVSTFSHDIHPLQVTNSNELDILKFYLIQEYCNGGTLQAALCQGLFTPKYMKSRWKPLMKVLLEVADGMTYMHHKRICHGDLNPANILLKVNVRRYIHLLKN